MGLAKVCADQDLRHRILVDKDFSVPKINRLIAREAVSIMTTSLDKETSGWFRTPFLKALIMSSPIPVIVMANTDQTVPSPDGSIFTHVIFATDWSPVAEKTLAYLLHFQALIKELEIITVISSKLSVRDMRNMIKRLAETREKFLSAGIDAEAHIYAGNPAEEIMLAARDYGGTAIAMGTTRRSSLKTVFSRSCSYEVTEKTAVPLLLIP
jgi:nucleotide-binding universal stress UspA family protein